MTLRFGVTGAGLIGKERIRRCTQILRGATVVAKADINAESVMASSGIDGESSARLMALSGKTINDVKAGQLHGSSAWDGYAASVAADVSLKTAESGETVSVTLPERPSFYQR